MKLDHEFFRKIGQKGGQARQDSPKKYELTPEDKAKGGAKSRGGGRPRKVVDITPGPPHSVVIPEIYRVPEPPEETNQETNDVAHEEAHSN